MLSGGRGTNSRALCVRRCAGVGRHRSHGSITQIIAGPSNATAQAAWTRDTLSPTETEMWSLPAEHREHRCYSVPRVNIIQIMNGLKKKN